MESWRLAVIALITSIVGLIMVFFYFWVGLVLCVVGLILSGLANKVEKTIMGKLGILFSFVGLVLTMVVAIIYIACVITNFTFGLGGLGALSNLM